ncbi:MAG: 6-aminohexanoate hydrolase [Aestuariivita sp.]|nr:6-aminohexanoate hydrolase [Aestuariivita sp.]
MNESYKNSDNPPPIMKGSPPPQNMRPSKMDWDRAPWNRYTFQRVREFLPTAPILKGNDISKLSDDHQDIGDIVFHSDGIKKNISQMIEDTYTDGMLIYLTGKVIHESYYNGMSKRSLHLCQSVSKSITATAAASLIECNLMDPNAPIVEYLPELEKTAWNGTTLQQVFDMTTGVQYDETYEKPDSDMGITDFASGWKPGPQGIDIENWPNTIWDQILSLKIQDTPHGSRFKYRSIETDVLAHAMERVTNARLPQIISERVWSSMGAEEDANITVDSSGYGLACGGISASLRDLARFGIAMLNDGIINNCQVIPRSWIEDVRMGAHGHFNEAGRRYFPHGCYRNHFWIEDVNKQSHLCLGVFGQTVYVSPERNMVAVKFSSWPVFQNADYLRQSLNAFHAISDAFGTSDLT